MLKIPSRIKKILKIPNDDTHSFNLRKEQREILFFWAQIQRTLAWKSSPKNRILEA
jgi:hypothetical protein